MEKNRKNDMDTLILSGLGSVLFWMYSGQYRVLSHPLRCGAYIKACSTTNKRYSCVVYRNIQGDVGLCQAM